MTGTTANPEGVRQFGEMMMRGKTPEVDISKDAVEEMALMLDTEIERLCGAKSKEAQVLRAQSARIAELEAAIKRQSGAAKTLRNLTLSEVQHLKDKDRSEYTASKTVDSEREANAILTDRVEELEAQNEALKSERAGIISTKREQIERLEAALQNVMGHINTPVSRRRLGISNERPEWFSSGCDALIPSNPTKGSAE